MSYRLSCWLSLSFLLGWWWNSSLPLWAQPITPATDGTGTTVNQQGNQFNVGGGTLSGDGQNLFHSLQQFGLDQHQIANFLSNPQIRNILTRIVGGDASVINGLIQVTGGNSNLFLMNPAGMLFGPNASINVPGDFVVTTATGIGFGAEQWFNASGDNNYATLMGDPTQFTFDLANPGAIINAGDLAVGDGQTLALLGGTVINTGSLSAPGGNIVIAAVPGSNRIRLSQPGNLLALEIEVAPGGNQSISVLDLPTLLTLGATGLETDGNGTVTVAGTGDPVRATPGSVTVTGVVDASSATGDGGQTAIAGDRVALLGATVNVSGVGNGGIANIGGDFQGQGTLPASEVTVVDVNTVIRADAGNGGDGGTVVVWSDGETQFGGTVTAKGGGVKGDGGLVETSGLVNLQIDESASVSTIAPNGNKGTWLIDPTDLVVEASGTGTIDPNGENDPAASSISAATIVAGLGVSNVALSADNSITVNQAIDSSADPGSGDLSFNTITINLNQPITLFSGRVLSGTPTVVNVGAQGSVQNGVDIVAIGGEVNLAPSTYTLSQEITVEKSLDIQGQGADNTIISGNNSTRVLNISNPDAMVTVTLDGLTIANGQGETGGGINNNGAAVTVRNSTISGNSATSGGGIYNVGGTVTVTSSTLSGNTAGSGSGGGIANNGGVVTVNNSTISGNTASSGGGIYNGEGIVTIGNSTITNNTAELGGGFINYSGTVTVSNSIVAGNSASSGTTEVNNSDGSFISDGNNLVGQNGDAGGFPTSNSDILLGGSIGSAITPLGNYGGSTQTHALVSGSPAINAGNNALIPNDPNTESTFTGDQRGSLRIVDSTVDIGAFEVQETTSNITPVTDIPSDSPGGGEPENSPIPIPIPTAIVTPDLERFDFIINTTTPNKELERAPQPDLLPDTQNAISFGENFGSIVEVALCNEFSQFLDLDGVECYVNPVEPLSQVEAQTGVKSALAYIYFYDPEQGLQPETLWSLNESLDATLAPNLAPETNDQLVIVVATAEGLQSPLRIEGVTRGEVVKLINDFAQSLKLKAEASDYLPQSQALYNLIIRPVASSLAEVGVEHISVIVDRGIRSLPLAALQDVETGEYLIEQFSIGIMPSLSLTDRTVKSVQGKEVLAMGADTFPSQLNQAPLPAVPVELNMITNTLWRGKEFLNQDFTVENLVQSLSTQDYNLVHLATHGEFLPGNRNNSFVVFSDQTLTLDEFAKVGLDQPIDLLILSACETALGDFEAELGFAGLAVKSGARTAIGSLWYVSDAGTLALMSSFYDHLRRSPTKAHSLQQAQIDLLRQQITLVDGGLQLTDGTVIPLTGLPPDVLDNLGNEDLSHPYYWSAFTLVGNPW